MAIFMPIYRVLKRLRKEKVIDMRENKRLGIESFNKNEWKIFRMNAMNKLPEKRRFQFEKTKILFIEYETKQRNL